MKRKARIQIFVLACAVVLGVQPSVVAQQTAELPVFGSGTSVVAVPVFVTDKSGQAVSGLTQADFEVLDRGKGVPIVAFYEVDAGAPIPAVDAGPLTRAAARRQVLMLFDMTFSSVSSLIKARRAALDFVDAGLEPADLVAAATLGRNGFRFLIGFTSDRTQLRHAIDGLGIAQQAQWRDPLALAYDLGAQEFLDQLSAGSPGDGDTEGGTMARAVAETQLTAHMQTQIQLLSRGEETLYRQRVDGFVAGLEQLSRVLDSLQGRKQVVLLSAGFDQGLLTGAEGLKARQNSAAIAEGRVWEVDSEGHFGAASARFGMKQLFRTLAATDTVVHTVDIGGLASDVDVSAEGRLGVGRGQESLAQLALGSGGRFVKDTNDIAGALGEVMAASRYYYVLAFQPKDPGKKPGKLRKLKVRVAPNGLRVSHRSGYVLADPDKPVEAGTLTLQSAEVIAKGLAGGSFKLGAVAVPYRSARGGLSLSVLLQIDGAALAGKKRGKEGLRLQIFGYALDGQGRIRDVLTVSPTLDLAAVGPLVKEKGLQILTAFKVPAGAVDLRFLVRDDATGRAGSARLGLEMPALKGKELFVSSPLFMDDPRGRLVLPAPTRANPNMDIPFRLEDAPFTVEAFPSLKRGQEQEICLLTYRGPKYDTGASLEFEARLVSSDGRTFDLKSAGPPRVVADADGFQRFVLGVAPEGVSSGDYTLQVSVRDPAGGSLAMAEQPLHVH